MEISYAQLLSPNQITIPMVIGDEYKSIHLRKPTLKEIDLEIGFDLFQMYVFFISLTPKLYYEEIVKDEEDEFKEQWFNMSNDEKSNVTIYDLILHHNDIKKMFIGILNYFFIEDVIFDDESGKFIFINPNVEITSLDDLTRDDVCGIANGESVCILTDLMCSTCHVSKPKNEKVRYRNKKAQRIYEKINNGGKNKKSKNSNKNESIGNIISKVSNRHSSLNPINIWDLTYFQLIDTFITMQMNEGFDMNKMSVSVWGDKEKKFDSSLWYKNTFE